MIDIIVEAIVEKKGLDIVILDFKKHKDVIFDNFIICNGTSAPHIDAIVENIAHKLRKKIKTHGNNIEGKENREWVLMDYGNIIVHVFNENTRRFYNLEDLWGDAIIKKIDIENFKLNNKKNVRKPKSKKN